MLGRCWVLTLLSLVLLGCGSEVDAPTDAGSPSDSGGAKPCFEGTSSHPHGTSWNCSDGCNRCGCSDGVISSTGMACGCTDGTSFHLTGSTWICAEGCSICVCNKGGTVSVTGPSSSTACADAATD